MKTLKWSQIRFNFYFKRRNSQSHYMYNIQTSHVLLIDLFLVVYILNLKQSSATNKKSNSHHPGSGPLTTTFVFRHYVFRTKIRKYLNIVHHT